MAGSSLDLAPAARTAATERRERRRFARPGGLPHGIDAATQSFATVSRASVAVAKSRVKRAGTVCRAPRAASWFHRTGCYPARVVDLENPRSEERGAHGRRVLVILALGLVVALASASSWTRSAALAPADFAFANDVEVASLDPATVTGIGEGRVSRFLFEGLCVHDPKTLAILPGMAESWTISPDGREYVFAIRAGARWSNGERLTARDFAWSFERLLDPRTAAEYAYELWPVRGARAFTTEVDEHGAPTHPFDSVAIRARDERTLAIELDEPVPYFLDVLTMPALAPVNRGNLEEARARFPDTWSSEWMKPGRLVSNGPYTLALRRVNDRIRFAKNPAYWDAERVAFETVDALSVEHVGTMLNLYLTGAVGWADNAPASLMPRLTPREDFRRAPYLATSFYRVNVTRPPLDDKRVRRALALAIDRAAIVEKVTRAGEAAAWSFVPPSVSEPTGAEMAHDRSSDAAAAFAADVAESRRLLADAGFGPGARMLPPIEIHYNTQSNNKDVAEVIADSWRRNLDLEVELANQEWKVYLDTQKRLEYQVSRSSWIGDHPDPIGFLEIFESENNRTGWSSARYDDRLARARSARGEDRRRLLREAEEILLDELPILPLYFFVTKNLVDPRLGGFHDNALDEHSPKFWYWMDDEELHATRDAELRTFLDSTGASESAHGRIGVDSHGPREGLYPPADRKHRARERT
jgi:oligopeptide transport system substrate-binding protein